MNMTLMMRPQVWQAMYSASPLGTHLPAGDPTVLPRLLCVLTGGLVAGGLWLIYLASRESFSYGDREYLSRLGGRIAAIAALGELLAGNAVYRAQPAIVQAGLTDHLIYRAAGLGWILMMLIIVVFSGWAGFKKPIHALSGWLAVVIGFSEIALLTLYRDGIRDLTLESHGYDVWQRTVVTNWSVVGLFLVLFVAGLGVVGWLISIMARANRVMESTVEA
jgi:hypothetical protein